MPEQTQICKGGRGATQGTKVMEQLGWALQHWAVPQQMVAQVYLGVIQTESVAAMATMMRAS